jgi:hypothetical protein
MAGVRLSDMTRDEVILAALAPAKGREFTPVQVQKLFFLIDRVLGQRVSGPHFDFRPYHYGPFDAGVYQAIEGLAMRGQAAVGDGQEFQMRTYRLTPVGQAEGDRLLGDLEPEVADYFQRASDFVRSTPFAELVSSIYKAYPEMRARSIFRERR